MSAPGNIFCQKTKTIWFRITWSAGDPNLIFNLPDDLELSKKNIVGILANTGVDTFDWDGDIQGVYQPGFLPFGIISGELQVLTITLKNEKGEFIWENMPLNSLNSAKLRPGGFKEIPGFILPTKTKLNLRESYVRVIQPTTTFDGYIVFTFFYND